MGKTSFQKALLLEIKSFFSPLLSRLSYSDELLDFYVDMGYDIRTLLGSNLSQFNTSLSSLSVEVSKIDNISTGNLDSIINTIEAFIGIAQIPTKIGNIVNSFGSNSQHVQDLPNRTFEHLLLIHLSNNYPLIFSILELSTIIYNEPASPYSISISGQDVVVKNDSIRTRIDLGRLGQLLTNPNNLFKQEYFPNGVPNETEATAVGLKLFPRIAKVLNVLNIDAFVGMNIDSDLLTASEKERLKSILIVGKTFNLHTNAPGLIGTTLNITSDTEGEAGVFLQPWGSITISEEIAKWLFALNVTAAASGFKITDSGITFYDTSNSQFKFKLSADSISDADTPLRRIGSDKGTRFEIERMGFEAYLDLQPPDKLYGIMMKIHQMKFILKGGDGDGLVSKIIGDGIDAKFDFGIGWNNKDGVHFSGGGGFEKYIASGTKLGPLEFLGLRIGMGIQVGSGQTTKIPIYAGADIVVKMKALALRVEGVGLKMEISFPPNSSGNFGLFNADFGFKGPSGIGIKIDSAALIGEGYLYLKDGEYIGAIELTIKKKNITISAVGILTTKLPSGEAGYSFLIVAGVTGLNIALGMGFFLDGIGGMLGLHRTMDKDALRDGIKSNSLASVLFPTNILANIYKIVSDLNSLFPIKKDQFLIAPMIRITWGKPALIYGDVGVVIEFGGSFRIGILGRVYSHLPTEDMDIIRLNVAFFGYLDFENKEIYFDASIYNSQLALFKIEGDMALRIFYGKQKEFVITVGGFHPEFRPAAHLQLAHVKRVTISLLSDNPCLRVQCYVAITSNTVQFGASAYFRFDGWVFLVEGGLSFDALFQFSPFRFVVQFHAFVRLQAFGFDLLDISLRIRLSGTSPWNAYIKAKIDLCFFISVTVSLNHTWGEDIDTTLPSIAIVPKLLEEFNKLQNWKVELPEKKENLVKLAPLPPDKIILDTMGRIVVTQDLVPLEKKIDKMGGYPLLDGHNGYKIATVKNKTTNTLATKSHYYASFASAQFFNYTDQQRLAMRSFEDHVSGVLIGDDSISLGASVDAVVDYEISFIDMEVVANTKKGNLANTNVFGSATPGHKFLSGNHIASSEIAVHNKLLNTDIGMVSLHNKEYKIINRLTRLDWNSLRYNTEADAQIALLNLEISDPRTEGKYAVINA